MVKIISHNIGCILTFFVIINRLITNIINDYFIISIINQRVVKTGKDIT